MPPNATASFAEHPINEGTAADGKFRRRLARRQGVALEEIEAGNERQGKQLPIARRHYTKRMLMPPSTLSATPVTYFASSEAR